MPKVISLENGLLNVYINEEKTIYIPGKREIELTDDEFKLKQIKDLITRKKLFVVKQQKNGVTKNEVKKEAKSEVHYEKPVKEEKNPFQ